MIDFLWGLAGALVAAVAVGVLLNLVLEVVAAPATLRPTTSDKVLGFVIGVTVMVALTSATMAITADPSAFVDQLSLGAGLAAVFGSPPFFALARGHRTTPAPRRGSDTRRPGRFVPPAAFSEAVRRRFSSPDIRARYVIAAYRRGLIPAQYLPGLAAELAPLLPFDAPAWNELAEHDGDGLDDVVDRAAREIGFAATPEEQWEEVVERLVHHAMSSSDPAVRSATAELLAPPVAPVADVLAEGDPRRYGRWERSTQLRAAIADALNARYEERLGEAVRRRFADPTVRARYLVAAYRHRLIPAAAVPGAAAEIFVDLPGADEAWTELAMAANDAWRSDLDPIMDRAAAEIDYEADARSEAIAIVEMAAYRAVVADDVMGQAEPLWDEGYDSYVPAAFDDFLDVHVIYGFDVPEQLARIRSDLATHLNDRYG